MKTIGFVLAMVAAAACGGAKKKTEQPAAESPPAISNTVVEEPPPPPPPEPQVASRSTGVHACDEYLALMDQVLVECAKELGPALDAMKQSVDAQRESFAQWDQLDPESRAAAYEAAATGCQAANDAIRQAVVGLNCTLSH